ncbi:MAG: cytochrome c [Anaerolineae bacterium]|nr:cytochrome c [Anaerolineae bacterium]
MRLFVGLVVLLVFVMVGCAPYAPTSIAYEEIPSEGDINRGAELFNAPTNGTTACISCHVESNAASPNLEGLADVAASRVEEETAREYVFYSITEPARHITEGFGNAMPNDYDEKLSPQQIADLIAYVLSL